MRIVHVTDVYRPRVGGIETQVQTLAEHQRAEGHDVIVVTRTPGPRSSAIRRCSWREVAHRPGLLAELSPDVVHGHMSVASPLTVRLAATAARRGVPVAMTVHSLWPARAAPLRAVLGPVDWLSAVTWSAVSRVAADRVRATLPPGRRVAVVPNQVATGWWRRTTDRPVGGGQLHAVLVNRLARRKRVRPFVELLAGGLPSGLAVTIVGGGPRRAEVAAAIDRFGLGSRVRLVGELPATEIRTLLHRADVFVAPARLESFGIAALEARAAGVPVLGYAGTGLADFVTDGHDGRLVGSDRDLVDVLFRLAREPLTLQAWQRAAARPPRVDAVTAARAVTSLYARARDQRPTPASVAWHRAPVPT